MKNCFFVNEWMVFSSKAFSLVLLSQKFKANDLILNIKTSVTVFQYIPYIIWRSIFSKTVPISLEAELKLGKEANRSPNFHSVLSRRANQCYEQISWQRNVPQSWLRFPALRHRWKTVGDCCLKCLGSNSYLRRLQWFEVQLQPADILLAFHENGSHQFPRTCFAVSRGHESPYLCNIFF